MSTVPSKTQQRPSAATPAPTDWHDPLAAAFRRWGHLQAEVDPVGRWQAEVHPDLEELSAGASPERLAALRRAYCGSIGVEFMHLRDRERVLWIAQRMESDVPAPVDRARVIRRLMEAELFERFLHKRYVGSKRYSLEGATGLIVLLDAVLDTAAAEHMETAILGMSHRGRLTVMVNTVGVPPEALFAGLEDVDPRASLGAGDVKYHLGATGVHRRPEGGDVRVHLASNPSHLEAVNPVLMGRARARQTRIGAGGERKVLPVCLHGDAAFAGQGITSETLNLADLPGYRVGGTIQIIVNNLIGFTAEPISLHSSRYSSDAAKRIDVPVLHVNGEDPQALERAGRIAVEFRQRFGSDVVIDLIAFRRYGHSEVEDPTTTSPLLYAGLQDRPLLFEQIAREWDIDETSLEAERQEIEKRYSEAQDLGRRSTSRPPLSTLPYYWDGYVGGQYDPDSEVATRVDVSVLEEIATALTTLPTDFHVHPKIEKFLEQRASMLRGQAPLDFGTAEAAAFGSLLAAGHLVRVTGQDSCRGTFNHRNAVLVDATDGHRISPLDALARDRARLEIYDSPLSEAAVLGYEYGFSRDYPDGLVVWEAQFGDFVNGAQIIIDQFLAAGEDKWRLLSGLVMLLPHGYEGQGPEHSSARMERFLQLASEHNLQIAQPSTAAQYFHLLRRQVLRRWRKPLVVFTPKSMLRSKLSSSERDALVQGGFERVLVDAPEQDVDRVLICSGKIVHELRTERARREDVHTAIVCIEQLYPLPETEIHAALVRFKHARKVIWVQEEPANMGALVFIRPELHRLAGGRHVTTVKRSSSASPATGSAQAHRMEQEALIRLAFA